MRKKTVFSIITTSDAPLKRGTLTLSFSTPVSGNWDASGDLFENAAGSWTQPLPNVVVLNGKKNKCEMRPLAPSQVAAKASGNISGDLIRGGEILEWTCTSTEG